MGERKGQNKYYAPDFDWKVHGSLAGYHGEHPLRERAHKIHLGILVIRFEMPYNIWCEGCKEHIAMGVRYNAEKKKIGMYFTTPIWEFRMKCHLCPNYIVIKTDPQNQDYIITEGARRKEQRWDASQNGQVLAQDRATHAQLETDAMFKLQYDAEDKSKMATKMPDLDDLRRERKSWKNDADLNSLLRSNFRCEKKVIAEKKAESEAVLGNVAERFQLLPEAESDKKIAKFIYDQKKESSVSNTAKRRLESIKTGSIFATAAKKPKISSIKSSSESTPSTSEESAQVSTKSDSVVKPPSSIKTSTSSLTMKPKLLSLKRLLKR